MTPRWRGHEGQGQGKSKFTWHARPREPSREPEQCLSVKGGQRYAHQIHETMAIGASREHEDA